MDPVLSDVRATLDGDGSERRKVEHDEMNLLRRWFGGGEREASAPASAGPGEAAEPDDAASLDDLERAHELEMARAEQERLDDLQQRQLRYASFAWQPPDQGGERRADDKADEAN